MKFYLEVDDEEVTQYLFHCPGCGYPHWVRTKGPGPLWTVTFNGDVDRPTVMPSLLVQPNQPQQCHSFIRDGQIQFLDDSHHGLAGQTVELPEWEDA